LSQRAMRSSARDAGCGIRHPRLALISSVGAAPLSGRLRMAVGTSRRSPMICSPRSRESGSEPHGLRRPSHLARWERLRLDCETLVLAQEATRSNIKAGAHGLRRRGACRPGGGGGG
jgi:hypothetical protein